LEEKPERKRTLKKPSVGGRIILKLIFMKYNCGVNWIELAKHKQNLRALENAVIKFRFPQNAGNFLSSRRTVGFSGRTQLSSVELAAVSSPCVGSTPVSAPFHTLHGVRNRVDEAPRYAGWVCT
jgi:hypothetical protein